jgi:alpha-ketoglutarate-dependent taurine dioxygenase
VLETVDLTPTIGTRVVIDAETLLAGTVADELRALLVRRGVLVIRGVELDDDQLRVFSATLGELRMGTVYEQANAGMLKVFDIPGTYFWHIDGTYTGLPPFATVLTARVVAPEGGSTEFANTYASYDDLPADEKEYLETLEVVHTMMAGSVNAVAEPTLEQFQSWMGHKQTHPLVWQHNSGRNSLLIGATASHIVGLHLADGRALLDRLTAHATQDQYVYRHQWELGDIVVWDNTGTMHRVRPFDVSSGREMHRFTLEGIEPVVGATQRSHA